MPVSQRLLRTIEQVEKLSPEWKLDGNPPLSYDLCFRKQTEGGIIEGKITHFDSNTSTIDSTPTYIFSFGILFYPQARLDIEGNVIPKSWLGTSRKKDDPIHLPGDCIIIYREHPVEDHEHLLSYVKKTKAWQDWEVKEHTRRKLAQECTDGFFNN